MLKPRRIFRVMMPSKKNNAFALMIMYLNYTLIFFVDPAYAYAKENNTTSF